RCGCGSNAGITPPSGDGGSVSIADSARHRGPALSLSPLGEGKEDPIADHFRRVERDFCCCGVFPASGAAFIPGRSAGAAGGVAAGAAGTVTAGAVGADAGGAVGRSPDRTMTAATTRLRHAAPNAAPPSATGRHGFDSRFLRGFTSRAF